MNNAHIIILCFIMLITYVSLYDNNYTRINEN